MGAKKAGVKFVFVPKENEDDFNKIIKKNTTLIDEDFKVKIVSHISEILDYVILDEKIVNKLRENNKLGDITFEKTFDVKTYFK
jgi:ATP-dependent Lon protease